MKYTVTYSEVVSRTWTREIEASSEEEASDLFDREIDNEPCDGEANILESDFRIQEHDWE